MPRPVLPRQSADDAVSLEERLRQLEARLALLERLPAGEQVQNSDFAPLPGQIVTVEAPPAGLAILLPTPRPQIRNARITVSARNANPVRWQAVDGTVNGVPMVTSNAAGLIEAVCDGESWHVSQGAASTTGSVASIAGATYFVETADTGLPNARVGTDSTEIDVDYTVASVVSWALRASSVVFAKLQNLTGLSVLGRAANSAGVMAAITASNAREVLRVNDAGTQLEWGQPVDVWAPDGTDQGDFNTLDFRSQTSIIADGGSFSGGRWQVRMKRAALTGVILAGEDSNDTTFDSSVAGAGLSLSSGDTVIDWDGVLVSQGPTGIGTFRSLDFLDGTNTTANLSDAGGGVVAIAYDVDLSSVTYTAGDGIDLASNVFSADVSDFAGSGLEDDGSNNLRIAAAAAGNGLTGGGGSALAVGGSTSIIVGANDVQRAALTGEVTAGQNANALTVTRSTNFQSSPWTGSHQFNAAIVSGGEFNLTLSAATTSNVAIGAVSFVGFTPAFGLDTVTGMVPSFDGQLVWIENESSTIGLVLAHDTTSTAANRFYLPSAQNFFVPALTGIWARYSVALDRWIISDTKQFAGLTVTDVGAVLTRTGVGNLALNEGTGIAITTSTSGTAPSVRCDATWAIDQAANLTWTGTQHFDEIFIGEQATSPSTSAGNGMFWVRDDAPTLPMFTGDTNVDVPLANSIAKKTAATTVSAATTVLDICGTFSVPANSLVVGSRFKLDATYIFTRGATATALNLTTQFVIGANGLSVVFAGNTTAGTYQVRVMGELTVISTGAGGTMMGVLSVFGPAQTAASQQQHSSGIAIAINTTVANTIQGVAAMGTAVAGTSIQAAGGSVVWMS